ncbi:MAG: hypothetical protein D6683_04610 [Actinomyces sp.]|nr:MAG: hypothetical protein D6683_04610 [Actinomyces sp.]
MAGAIVFAVVLVVVFPVVVLMSGAVAAAILGGVLQAERDAAHAGSEYLALAHADPWHQGD